MEPFEVLTAVAAPIDRDDVDTDQLLPARFLLKRRSDPAYPTFLFHDQRFDGQGQPRPAFVLNRPAYAPARMLVGRRNFGGGSSREAAAIALWAAGFRVVIAQSFGDIFYANCVKNGILPVRLEAAAVQSLQAQLQAQPGTALTVDLPQQQVRTPNGACHAFDIDAYSKDCLRQGLSQIGLTLRHRANIDAFESAYRARHPWF